MGTPESYCQAHADLLASDDKLGLDHPDWPILTYGPQHLPARILQQAKVANSLVSPGCTVGGTVVDSVLSPGVVVEPGATVSRSVLLHDVRVKAGAQVISAVVDEGAEIGSQAVVGGEKNKPTLVGKDARVPTGERIAPGETVPPA